MTLTCRIYGLGVRVNVPIAALRDLPAAGLADVHLSIDEDDASIDEGPWSHYYASSDLDSRGVPNIRVERRDCPDRFRFLYEDGTRIAIDANGSRIWARSARGASIEDTATYLLGPTLGFVLQLRGVTCLHASVAEIDGRAVALVGGAGYGKSSLAAAMARRGHAILADDLAALVDGGGQFSISPAYPRIRLWPQTAEALFGGLPRITETWDKRFLALDDGPFRFQREALPLSNVYLIGKRGIEGAPRIAPIHAGEALIRLIGNSYTANLLDRGMRAREFEVLARLAKCVPVREAFAADDLTRLDELCQLIERDV